jgi:hypothetical protein
MKILVVARDLGPSKSLVRVVSGAIDRNHWVRASFFNELGDWKKLLEWGPDVLLFSPPSRDFENTLSLCQVAQVSGIRVALFSDTYGVYGRPSFEGFWPDVVFVPDVVEAENAWRYRHKNVVVSGVPLWEDFFNPDFYLDRIIARDCLGIKSDEIAVMFTGIKKSDLTKAALVDVLCALNEAEKQWVFLPRFHPGDAELKTGFYDGALARFVGSLIDTSKFSPAEKILPAVDLLISLHSTTAIAAACRRQPVIEYLPLPIAEDLKTQVPFGIWPPAESGITKKVSTREELGAALEELLTSEGKEALVEQQIAKGPKAEKGAAAKIILDELEKLVE